MASSERLNTFVLVLLITSMEVSITTAKSGPAIPNVNATGVMGSGVDLKCKVKLQECGNFFSIEWYRDFVSLASGSREGEPELVAHKTSHRQRRHHHLRYPQVWRGPESDWNHTADGRPRARREAGEEEDGQPAVESERVYVYRHHSGLSKSEGLWEGRASHQYDTRRHVMTVR